MSRITTLGRIELFGWLVVAGLVLMAVAYPVQHILSASQKARDVQLAIAQNAVEARATATFNAFLYTLQGDWEQLQVLSETIAETPPEQLAAALRVFARDGGRISWVGFADAQGIIRASANDVLLGRDVSARPWFQQGLTAPFGGNAHEAVLLSEVLGRPKGEPFRLLDLAAPVRDAEGRILGVIGAHISVGWAEDFLKKGAGAAKIRVAILNDKGEAEIDPERLLQGKVWTGATLPPDAPAAGWMTWPDGQSNITVLVPETTLPGMPRFGWTLLARLDADVFPDVRKSVLTDLQTAILIGAFVLAVAVTGGFVLARLR